MVSADPLLPPFPHPHSILLGGLNLKICQNFGGLKYFLAFVGNKPLWGELKLYGVSNIYYYRFIISIL